MALPEVPQLLSSEVKIRPSSLPGPGHVCAPRTGTKWGLVNSSGARLWPLRVDRVHLPSLWNYFVCRHLCFLISGGASYLDDCVLETRELEHSSIAVSVENSGNKGGKGASVPALHAPHTLQTRCSHMPPWGRELATVSPPSPIQQGL